MSTQTGDTSPSDPKTLFCPVISSQNNLVWLHRAYDHILVAVKVITASLIPKLPGLTLQWSFRTIVITKLSTNNVPRFSHHFLHENSVKLADYGQHIEMSVNHGWKISENNSQKAKICNSNLTSTSPYQDRLYSTLLVSFSIVFSSEKQIFFRTFFEDF